MSDEQKSAAGGAKEKDNEKLMGALAYAGILFVVPLFMPGKKSPSVQFHVRQGIVLFVIEAVLAAIPLFGWMLIAVPIIASIYGIMQALAGRQWELPIVGKYAKRINL
jgi:uncharacterized membrane protein